MMRAGSSEEAYLTALGRYYHDIRTGAIKLNHRTGACGPGIATQTQSWGAACPPGGMCSPDNLPAALGRYFAGDRAGCRELPFCISGELTSDDTDTLSLVLSDTSPVTMCATRLIVVTDYPGTGPHNQWEINEIKFGNQNQIVGGPVGADVFYPLNFNQTVPFVPDCLRAGTPYRIELSLKPDAMATLRHIALVFIGPMVG